MAGDIRPEGTDTIIDDGTTAATEHERLGDAAGQAFTGAAGGTGAPSGAGTTSGASGGTGAGTDVRGTFEQLKQAAFDQSSEFRAQATERAMDWAGQGKDKATEALENLARMVSDAAQQVEEKVGPDYAVHARRAAETVSGLADSLKSKDIDALLEDARAYVRSSPAVAIGAAAALGFVVARLAKSGFPAASGEAETPPTGTERAD